MGKLGEVKMVPTLETVARSWEKYGLIVVGNIVFFALLYVFSYRPHNEESRAAEFISMAQQEEIAQRHQAAATLYEKVVVDYGDTRFGQIARDRLAAIKVLASTEKDSEQCDESRFSLDEVLAQHPALFLSRWLAAQLGHRPGKRAAILSSVKELLWLAINREGVTLDSLRKEPLLGKKPFSSILAIQGRCEMKTDWIYDDFSIRNTGIFPWHHAVVTVSVRQGDQMEKKRVTIPYLGPGKEVGVLSFRVRKGAGVVICKGAVRANEGKGTFTTKL